MLKELIEYVKKNKFVTSVCSCGYQNHYRYDGDQLLFDAACPCNRSLDENDDPETSSVRKADDNDLKWYISPQNGWIDRIKQLLNSNQK